MRRATRAIAAVAASGAVLLGVPYFLALDPRLHPWSANGAKGFVLYLVGD